MNPAPTQALLSLVAQDWDLFADAAAQAWLGWGSGETGRLTAAAFRTAAAPATAQAWFTAAGSIDVTDSSRVNRPIIWFWRTFRDAGSLGVGALGVWLLSAVAGFCFRSCRRW